MRRTASWLGELTRDIRYAGRGLRRAPGFTATVIVTLGLGLGANAAMFNVVDRLMFRPLAYLRDPGSVHRVYWQWQDRGHTTTSLSTQYARYLDLQNWSSSFSQVAGFSERDLAIGRGESSRERRVGAVSASYFDLFDANPVLGRFFTAAEDVTPRGADVAVLSHAFWQAEFGGRDVRGDVLQVGDVAATIVGVAPDGFNGVNDANPPAVYIPITTFAGSSGTSDAKTYFSTYQWGWMHVLVRRKPGVSVERAEADATQAFRRSWEAGRAHEPTKSELRDAHPRVAISSVRPAAGPNPALEARTALWLAIVSGIVLLIACANVANLLLARAHGRQREIAIRLALGAGRGQLMLQSTVETLILASMGGMAALIVAQWAGEAIRRILVTPSAAAASPVFTDWRTVMVTGVVAVVTGLLLGLAPFLWSATGDLTQPLRRGSRGGLSHGVRTRAVLVVVQAALSVVLLTGAVLFVRSLNGVAMMPMGYEPDRVLLVNRIVRGAPFTAETARAMRDALMSAASALPEVESAAWVSSAPFVSTSYTKLHVPGVDGVDAMGDFTYQATTPDYFRTMGTRILRGRGLTADDRAGTADVAVVSASMARALWPGQEAIGKCFRMRIETAPCVVVVGIAEDMVQRDVAGTNRYHYYVSVDQYTRTWGNGMLVRLRVDPAIHAETIRKALQRAMPGESYVTVQPLQRIVEDSRRSWRLGATVFVAFGTLALIVAAVGLYGVIAYDVTQRMQEIALRVALGAGRSDILRLVMTRGLRFAIAGVVLGTSAAVLASDRIQPLLFRQSAIDVRVHAMVGLTMIVVALAATAVPALRAIRADPNAALKAE